MRSRYSTLAAAVALALGSSAVGAAGVDDIFSIRGYGTLGGLYSSEDNADYVRDMFAQPEGVGHSEEVSYAVDSKTAIQLDMTFTERFSAVVQLVSEGQYGNPWGDEPEELWHPTLEWANLSYRVTDNFTVRGGRIVLPFLMSAEYQKVGYANHWMRSPVEVYGKVSYSSVDGGDMMFKHDIGSGRNTIRAFGGQQKARRDEPLASWNADMFGFTDTYENGALTLRAAYLQAKVGQNTDDPAQMNSMLAMARGLGTLGTLGIVSPADSQSILTASAQITALAGVRDPNHKLDVEFYDLGATYDTGDWFVMAEVFLGRGSLMVPEHDSGYVSGGVRLNKWTPYATFSRTDATPFDAIPVSGLASLQSIPQIAQMIDAINQINSRSGSYSQDQDSVSVGLRWDVASNVAIKAQYDYVMLPDESTGMFVNRQPGFEAGTDVSLFGLSVDFLF